MKTARFTWALLCFLVASLRLSAIDNCITNWAQFAPNAGLITNIVRVTNTYSCVATASQTVIDSSACSGSFAKRVITGSEIPATTDPCGAGDGSFYADGAVWWGSVDKSFASSGDGPGGTCTLTAHYWAESYRTNKEVGYFTPRAGMDALFDTELKAIADLNTETQKHIDGYFIDLGGGCCYADPDPTQVNYLIKNVSGYRVCWFPINPVVPGFFSQPGGGYDYATGGWQRYGLGNLDDIVKPSVHEETTGEFVQFAEFMLFQYDGGDPVGRAGWIAVKATGERINVNAAPCGGNPLGDGLGGTNSAGATLSVGTNTPWSGGWTNAAFKALTNSLGTNAMGWLQSPTGSVGGRHWVLGGFPEAFGVDYKLDVAVDEGPMGDFAKAVRGMLQWALAVGTIYSCWSMLIGVFEAKK